MLDLSQFTEFEWDKGNIDKSYEKHGITPNEAEEVFLDKNILILEDIKHSKREERFMAIGKIAAGSVLFLAFTVRKDNIRIISARKANKKERRLYEQNI
ncbi:BrnT family toxin [Candidatus Gottesmanbacteria bacterium]|nr:BrnT family toxin [Candidatus Gottesmanbacteria bacterium]